MLAANSGTEVGIVGDGELDGNDNAPMSLRLPNTRTLRATAISTSGDYDTTTL